MAGLKRTQRTGARTGATDTFYSDDDYSRDEYPREDRRRTAHARPPVRPRFGTGARPAGARVRSSDGLLHWRLLALGACALILGTGGVIAVRAMAPVALPQAANGAAATPAPATPALAAATSLPATAKPVTAKPVTAKPTNALQTAAGSAGLDAGAPNAGTSGSPAAALATANTGAKSPAALPAPARAVAEAALPATGSPVTARAVNAVPPANAQASAAGHAEMATHVASILGAGAPAPATDPAAIPSAPPTADDLARPAFLEPLDGEEADLPEGAAEAAGDAVPLPTPRPADATAATDADGARSARIRSAVTLRSGPRRSASAIGTLDEGTRVTLYSCKSWCEVSSGDKRGFIYKTAVAQ